MTASHFACPSGSREVWLPIEGSDLYEISNLGQVRNINTGRVLRPSVNRGYAHVALYHQSGHPETTYIHNALLRAFCGPPPFSGAEACHNDGDRTNNRLTNLRWGSRQDNVDDRGRHGHHPFGTRMRRHKLTEEKVMEMRAAVRNGKSTRSFAKDLGLSTHTVWCAVVGKTWKHVEGAVNNA